MILCKLLSAAVKIVGVVFLLFALLFAGSNLKIFPDFLALITIEGSPILNDPEIQWTALLCLVIFFAVFLFLRLYLTNRFAPRCQGAMQSWWGLRENGGRAMDCSADFFAAAFLIGLFFFNILLYTVYRNPSAEILFLIGGAVVGQGFALLAVSERGARRTKAGVLLIIMILLLGSLTSNINLSHAYEYHSRMRWFGPWDNPNIAGLLMGMGIMLALGLGFGVWSFGAGKIKKLLFTTLCLLTAILMGRGLLDSYSRGAWLGTLCGGACLIAKSVVGSQRLEVVRWIRKNTFSSVVIVISICVLTLWQFRSTDEIIARRIISITNQNDFSRHNRIFAWEGDWQMMSERPWFGFGWNQPQLMYENYYLPPKLTEHAAIEMNDYLMLGATLGIPALFCFGMYLWLSLTKKIGDGSQNPEFAEAEWLQITCRAGAIVLLVGFWFDGGLFKLATGSTFWILLELGNIRNVPRLDTNKH
jgi:hypothetical protein